GHSPASVLALDSTHVAPRLRATPVRSLAVTTHPYQLKICKTCYTKLGLRWVNVVATLATRRKNSALCLIRNQATGLKKRHRRRPGRVSWTSGLVSLQSGR